MIKFVTAWQLLDALQRIFMNFWQHFRLRRAGKEGITFLVYVSVLPAQSVLLKAHKGRGREERAREKVGLSKQMPFWLTTENEFSPKKKKKNPSFIIQSNLGSVELLILI